MARFLLRGGRVVVHTTVGGLLVVAGLVMLVTPGPGIVTIVLGLAVLAREYDWAARLDRRVRRRARGASDAARDRLARRGGRRGERRRRHRPAGSGRSARSAAGPVGEDAGAPPSDGTSERMRPAS